MLRRALLVSDHDLLDLSILTKILVVRHNALIREHGRQSDHINSGLFNDSNFTQFDSFKLFVLEYAAVI